VPTLDAHRLVLAQGLSASAALGMLPFAPWVLESLDATGAGWLAGVAYVLPAAGAAVAMPAWGKLADRWGRGPLLWRAQLGLAAALWLSAEARSVSAWLAALFLQGMLGGSLAAAKAYASATRGREAARRACDGLEAASRLAWVTGPMLVALLWRPEAPLEAARFLALLPLVGFLLCLGGREAATTDAVSAPRVSGSADAPAWFLPFAQFTLGFTATLFSPFLVTAGASPTASAFLFSSTHAVCFLALLGALGFASRRPRETFALALFGFLLAGVSHVESVTLLGRVGLGLALALGIRATNALATATVRREQAGSFFGWLESLARVSSILGGVAASFLVLWGGPEAPFVAATAAAAVAALVALLSIRSQSSSEVARALDA
jgi:MFS family permease